MSQIVILNFIKQHSGLGSNEISSIVQRCKYFSVKACQNFQLDSQDLKKYSFFISNSEGAILFSVCSVEGLEWRIICSDQMFFPYPSMNFSNSIVFNKGYACRTSHIIGIQNTDIVWLKENSQRFHQYMEIGIHRFLDHVISVKTACHNLRSKHRIRSAILLALEHYGYDLHTGERVTHFRQSDIAALAGTTIQTVCSVFNDLKAINVLRTRRKSIMMERKYFEKYRGQIC